MDKFRNFPKIRSNLPPELQKIFLSQHKLNREGQTTATKLSLIMESWLHRKIAGSAVRSPQMKTLEIGAGTLNQIPYEPETGTYDIIEPIDELYTGSPHLSRIKTIYTSIYEIPQTERYNRITSIAVLEHVCDLPELVAYSGQLLSDKGIFQASIPSEGTILWTLGWKLTTGLEFKFKHGLDYGLIMKHEHVNTADEIEDVLRHFFKKIRCHTFGLSKNLSFYRYYECWSPILDRCRSYNPHRMKPSTN